jgi:hypothetical protein
MRPIRTEAGEMSIWQLGNVTNEVKLHVVIRAAHFKRNWEITVTILRNPTVVKGRLENLTKYRSLW